MKKYTFEQERNKDKKWYMKNDHIAFQVLICCIKKGVNTASSVMLDVRELFYVNFVGDDWILCQSSLVLFGKIL